MHLAKPTLVGAAMALGMLALMHDAIMAGTLTISFGAVVFALLHVLGLGVLAFLLLMSRSVRRAVRTHRPSFSHVAAMLIGMSVAAALAHLVMHGVA